MFPDEDLPRARQSVAPVSRRRRTILDVSPAHVRRIKARPACHGESRRASWRVPGLLRSSRSTALPALTVANGVTRRCGRACPRAAGRHRCQRSPRHPSEWKLAARCRSSSASACQKKRGSLVRPANRTKGGQPFQAAAVFPLYTPRIFGIFGSI